ncbi:hypothetical protein F66182_5431 [Fusarium sp. NRRL 66182]|nr:hypothetical protein F66182_5431 [Fusarium sp. NRRL 66182]
MGGFPPNDYLMEQEKSLQLEALNSPMHASQAQAQAQAPSFASHLPTSHSTSSPDTISSLTGPRKRQRTYFETETTATADHWGSRDLDADESELYFNAFFSGCHRYVPVFHPQYDSMQSIRDRSDLLFTTICSVGCRVLNGTSSRWRTLAFRTQRMLNAAIANPSLGDLETVQALLVQACYASERALLISVATRIALDLGFSEAYDTLVAQYALRETQRNNGSETASDQDLKLMRRTRAWLHLLVMSYILHVDAGGLSTFKFRGASRRCRILLQRSISTRMDHYLFAQVELNVLRARIYDSLPQGASLDDEEILDSVRDAKLDIDVWFNDWMRISERHHQDMPWFAPNLAVQRCWADNMALCRAVRASGVENVNVMSPIQRNILLMTKDSLKHNLDIIIQEPRIYLESLRYAMDFVWAKNTFCCLLLLKLSALLPDEDSQQSRDSAYELVDKASILLQELEKVADGGLRDDNRSNTSALYLKLLKLSIQKYKQGLVQHSEEYQQDVLDPGSIPSSSSGPNPARYSELESFVPDQFVFEWDFPGLTLFSSPIHEAAWLNDFVAGTQELGDNNYNFNWALMDFSM